jgi:GT2 family glycosyltransferase
VRNLIVLGMHRSGTSMVAGALAAQGMTVGAPSELLFDQEDNPHGFFERRDVVELNNAILAHSGGEWFRPPPEISVDPELVAKAATLLKYLGAGPFLLKDPRMVLTWPIWQEVLPQPQFVFVYRHPMAVAESLRRRNHFPLQYGLALWEYYNRTALEMIGGTDAVCVSYEAFAGAPEVELSRLIQHLNERGGDLDEAIAPGFFDSSLGGSSGAVTDLAILSAAQREMMHYCEALVKGEVVTTPVPAADDALLRRVDDFASAVAPLAEAREVEIRLSESVALCEERTGERDKVLAELELAAAEHKSLASAHDREVALHKRLEGIYKEELASHQLTRDAFHEMKGKAEYLFETLNRAYMDLLHYETSRLAGIQRFVARAYRFLTMRRGVRSKYDDALQDATEYIKHQDVALPEKPPSKLLLLGDVVRYVVENPAGSARSFSFQRLQRALQVLFSSSSEDFSVWVNSRFPDAETMGGVLAQDELGPELDQLSLQFPVHQEPLVSIVIPVYNEYRVTIHALQSILACSDSTDYEVIIADDGSTDLTTTIEERVAGLTVVRGEENLRFVGNCNRGAEAAVGKYILFLNNDTAVTEGWLDKLVAVVEKDALVGIVGPKLVYPTGRLQEAGGIVWRDGSAWNYGRMDDPQKPEYNYLKTVDYISGACLMIRGALWRELGGFDRRLMPAYYEDTDIAFAVRELGYEVVYQPLSTVVHYEGVSNGLELDAGVKQHQVINQQKFLEKWQSVLDRDHFENAQNVFQARDRSRRQRTVLYVDHYVPHYDKDAGSRSTFQYVQLMLSMGYRVLFLGANFFAHQPYTRELQAMGVEVLVGEHMARNIDDWLLENARYIDVAYIHRPHIAEQFMKSLGKMKPRPKTIYFGHDLHYLRHGREADLSGDSAGRKTAESWKLREYRIFDQVDKVYYPSRVEVDEILANVPGLDVRAIPLYALPDVSIEPFDIDNCSDILFVGGFNHPPNVDAVCWFVEEVLPLANELGLDCKINIVGSNPVSAVQALQSGQVIVHGYLEDEQLDKLYSQVRLVVVPLRYGAGVKGKVIEAVQKGRILVTTPVGAEGIPDAENVMTVADTAGDFARSLVSAYGGCPDTLAKLDNYPDWLEQNFSQFRAAEIIVEDFGEPDRLEG